MDWPAEGTVETRDLILATLHVTESTVAAERQGDRRFFAALERFYALVSDRSKTGDGAVVKFMGDGVLIVFPPNRKKEAVRAVSEIQEAGTDLWREFDGKCRVQAKVGRGSVLMGTLADRRDVVGNALNALMKTPWQGDVFIDDRVGNANED